MTKLYSDKLIDLAASIPPARRLPNADASSFQRARLCGSEMTVDLMLDGGQVSDFAMEARACALGQAAAAIVSNGLVGAKPSELRQLRDDVDSMLKADGPPPSGAWADFAFLQPVKDYPQRHASTMLALNAVVDCLDQIAAGGQSA